MLLVHKVTMLLFLIPRWFFFVSLLLTCWFLKVRKNDCVKIL